MIHETSLLLREWRYTVPEAHVAASTSNLSNDSHAVTPTCTNWIGIVLDARVQAIIDAYGIVREFNVPVEIRDLRRVGRDFVVSLRHGVEAYDTCFELLAAKFGDFVENTSVVYTYLAADIHVLCSRLTVRLAVSTCSSLQYSSVKSEDS